MKAAAVFLTAMALAVSAAWPQAAGAQESAAAPAVAPAPAAAAPAPCTPQHGINFLCGLVNVEDMLPVDGGKALIGSSYKDGSIGFYLIDTAAKTAKVAKGRPGLRDLRALRGENPMCPIPLNRDSGAPGTWAVENRVASRTAGASMRVNL